jgi:GWxTD domain-containing protein
MGFPPAREWVRRILVPLILVAGLPPGAGGVVPPDEPTPTFLAEAAAFAENDTLKVFTYVEVPVRGLFFARRQEGVFEAVVDISVLVFQDRFQVAGDGWRHRIQAPSLLSARNSSRALRKTIRFPVPPGRYRVEVTVAQPEAGTEERRRLDVEVPAWPRRGLEGTSILFGMCPREGEAPEALLNDPLLGRRFGEPLVPSCAYTQVLHQPGVAESLTVVWVLETSDRETIRQGRFRVAARGRVTPVVVPLPVETLWMGTYGLLLRIRGGDDEIRIRTLFEMDETRISLTADFEQTLEMVRIIATDEEYRALAEAPEDERQAAWDNFWKQRDPTPETARNEFKEEFFRRVRYANRHFGVLEPGWKSDRGRVYILYGPPDQIESYPQNMGSPPYEIWDYYRLRLRFVFVDYDGFGRYELYRPGRH